jgi:hypothetical protein
VKQVYTTILLFFGLVPCVTSQTQQQTESYKKSWFAVPTLGSAPETGFYFGAVGYRLWKPNWDSLARTSFLKAEVMYTLKQQFITSFEINQTDRSQQWIWVGRNSWLRFPEYFWGIGRSEKSNQVQYDGYRLEIDNQLLHRHGAYVFSGLYQSFQSVYGVRPVGTLLPEKQAIYHQIISGISSGIGPTFLFDSRTNLLRPKSKEAYLRLEWLHFHPILGSHFTFQQMLVEGRYFFPLRKRDILAFQTICQARIGDAPFRMLSLMGGPMIQRGYYFGRFRDQNAWAAQTEWRKSFSRIFGMTAFLSTGAVFRTEGGVSGSGLRTAGGLGFRWSLIPGEETALRMDFAYTQDRDFGFYIGFGEAF